MWLLYYPVQQTVLNEYRWQNAWLCLCDILHTNIKAMGFSDIEIKVLFNSLTLSDVCVWQLTNNWFK